MRNGKSVGLAMCTWSSYRGAHSGVLGGGEGGPNLMAFTCDRGPGHAPWAHPVAHHTPLAKGVCGPTPYQFDCVVH